MKNLPSLSFLIHITFRLVFSTLSNIDMTSFDAASLQGLTSDIRIDNSIGYAGDVNGDGLDDLLIGSFLDNPLSRTAAGTVYVLFGTPTGISSFDLTTLSSTQGFRIMGEKAGDNLGVSAKYGGDFNGDGFDDIVVGAPFADPLSRTDAGCAYLIFGKPVGLADIDLAALTSDQGIRIMGAAAGGSLGKAANYAGDINKDGFADLIIGAPDADPPGRTDAGYAYVIFGKGSGLGNIDLNVLGASQGLVIKGAVAGDAAGNAVSYAGDFNDDTVDDIVVGAYYADPPTLTNAGIAYVIYGQTSGLTDIDLLTFSGANGIKITGAGNLDYFANSVSYAGDVNADGVDDIIVGAYKADPGSVIDSGRAYIIYGQSSGLVDIDLTSFTLLQGVKISGKFTNDYVGNSVSYARDINGDNIDDVIIGAYEGDPTAGTDAGCAYVVYGKAGGIPNLDINIIESDNTKGIKISGATPNQRFGISVGYAGNIDGRSAHNVIVKSASGAIHVVPGESTYTYWDSTQQTRCIFPLKMRKQGGVTYCDFPCSSSDYSYWNGTCQSTCSLPFKSRVFQGRNFCDYPCALTDYLLSDGTCGKSCPYESVTLGYRKYCMSEDPISTVMAVVSNMNSNTLLIISILASGDPIATIASVLAKMLLYTRYLDVTNSPRLKLVYNSTEIDPGCLEIAPEMPTELNDDYKDSYQNHEFSQYNVGPSFLANHWEALISMMIILAVFSIIWTVDLTLKRNPKRHFVWTLIAKLKIIAQNFTLQQFYMTLGDVILYSIIEMQAQGLSIFIFSFSFVLAVVCPIIVILMLTFHFLIIKRYQKLKKVEEATKVKEPRQKFMEKYAGFKVLFDEFKDTTTFSQSFLLIFIGRDILFSFILGLLYNHPMVQIILIIIMCAPVLGYLIKKRPHRDIIDQIEHFVLEITLLIVNFAFLLLAALDASETSYNEHHSHLGEAVIYCNILCHVLPLAFLISKIVLVIKRRWKIIRSAAGIRKILTDLINIVSFNLEEEEEDRKQTIRANAELHVKKTKSTEIVPNSESNVQTVASSKLENAPLPISQEKLLSNSPVDSSNNISDKKIEKSRFQKVKNVLGLFIQTKKSSTIKKAKKTQDLEDDRIKHEESVVALNLEACPQTKILGLRKTESLKSPKIKSPISNLIEVPNSGGPERRRLLKGRKTSKISPINEDSSAEYRLQRIQEFSIDRSKDEEGITPINLEIEVQGKSPIGSENPVSQSNLNVINPQKESQERRRVLKKK